VGAALVVGAVKSGKRRAAGRRAAAMKMAGTQQIQGKRTKPRRKARSR